jgi:hypothetical protein
LLAYLGPNVNLDALKPLSATGAGRQASSREPAIQIPFEPSALKQPEMPNWPS